MMYETRQLILTSQTESEPIALNELFSSNSAAKFIKWLDHGVALVEASSFRDVAASFAQNPPVFIQHVCPVNYILAITGEASDIAVISSVAKEAVTLLDLEKTFSVQTRVIGKKDYCYGGFEINTALSEKIIEQGLVLDIKAPQQTISVVCSEGFAYIGCSYTEDNLSSWGGGKHRFAREEGLVSRAEFKLLEAIDVFNLRLEGYSSALDLGAAPGGWTRVLRKYGLTVAAVDPAELSSGILADEGVIHYRQTAQTFFKNKREFDVIVNDMKMDAKESAMLMCDAADFLKTGGAAVLTLKLPEKNKQRLVKDCIEILKRRYSVTGARQLFHNRSEVTVVLRKIDIRY